MPQRSDAIQPIFFRRRLLQLLQMTVIPKPSLQSGRDSDDQLKHTTKHFAPLKEEFHWLKITPLVCFVLPCISPLLSSSSSILSHRFRPFLRPHESSFFSSHLISSPYGLFSSLLYTTLLSFPLLILNFFRYLASVLFCSCLSFLSRPPSSLSSSFVSLVLLRLSHPPSFLSSSFVSLVLLRLSHPPSSLSSSFFSL